MKTVRNYTYKPYQDYIHISGPYPYIVEKTYAPVSELYTFNEKPEVRIEITDYFFDLCRDKWFFNDINDILNYLTYSSDGKVSLIDDVSQYSKENIKNDTNEIVKKKVDYIIEKIFPRYKLKKLLGKIVERTSVSWAKLPQNKKEVKKIIYKHIIKKLNKEITNNKHKN